MQTAVHIMLMELVPGAHAERERELLPRLHAEERARYGAFTGERRRELWLAGRALLLAGLARVVNDVAPQSLRTAESGGVRYGEGGPCLSLSHSRELVAIALADAPVGVDLEWPAPRSLVAQAGRVFSAAEARALGALSADERREAFYILWTLKEAACKAAGLSLWEGLHGVSFDLEARRGTPQPPFPAGDWSFAHARLEPGWRLAVSLRGRMEAAPTECWRLAAPGRWQRQLFQEAILIRAG
ncbi:MAG TPA: 4'-phosphopantetheinyl transferase superfamily protein [Gammaproteobacteria bacterium]|nr:4'-phosphopantetheinyl transferase superfamily protein [Gammaproteobacteria bacterium]